MCNNLYGDDSVFEGQMRDGGSTGDEDKLQVCGCAAAPHLAIFMLCTGEPGVAARHGDPIFFHVIVCCVWGFSP